MLLLLKLFLLIYIVTFHQVDYVVGLDKVPIRQSTAAGNFYANSEEMVDYLMESSMKESFQHSSSKTLIVQC